jgi:Putative bacterial sensory transduction regulator
MDDGPKKERTSAVEATDRATPGLNVEMIGEYLRQFGWPFFEAVTTSDGRSAVRTGWRGVAGGFQVELSLLNEPVELVITAEYVITLKPAPETVTRDARVFAALLAANYVARRGTWAFDPRDGEVQFSVSHIVGRDGLGYEQFEVLLRTVVVLVDQWAPQIRALAAGREPAGVFEGVPGTGEDATGRRWPASVARQRAN